MLATDTPCSRAYFVHQTDSLAHVSLALMWYFCCNVVLMIFKLQQHFDYTLFVDLSLIKNYSITILCNHVSELYHTYQNKSYT